MANKRLFLYSYGYFGISNLGASLILGFIKTNSDEDDPREVDLGSYWGTRVDLEVSRGI